MAKEVENITRTRMVSRHDAAEYEQRGWKLVRDAGTQSAIMEKTEKVKVEAVPGEKTEKE